MAYDGSIKIAVDLDEKQLKSALSGIGNTTSKALGVAAKSVAAVGAAVVAAGGFAIKAGIEFESAFTGVVKTVNATDEQLAKLQDDLRDMAQNMPAAAADLADIAASAGQLGIQTDNIAGFTKTIADLGVASNLAGEEAAVMLARFANITGMAQQDFDRLGSTIVALGNNLATSEAEIAEMAMRLAGAGTQVGMTENQILSFAGALSSVGIEAEAGGTAFSTLMSNMQLAVETGNEDLTSFAQIAGMSASEFKKAFQQDAAGAIISFINGLGQAEEKGQSAIKMLSDMGITEVRMRDALLRASGASELFTNSLKIGSQAWEENTALTKEAEQRYKTLESQLGIFKNRVTEIGIAFKESIDGPLNSIVTEANNVMAELIQTVETQGMSALPQAIGTILGNVTAQIIGYIPTLLQTAITVISSFIMGIQQQLPAIQDAITTAVQSICDYMEQEGPGLAHAITSILATLVETILENLPQIMVTGQELIIELIKGITAKIPDLIPIAVDAVLTLIEGLLDNFDQVMDAGINLLLALADGLIEAIPLLVEKVPTIIIKLVAAIISMNAKLLEAGHELIQKLWEGIQTFASTLWNNITSFISQNVIEPAKNKLSEIFDAGKNLVQGLWNGISDSWNWLTTKISEWCNGILSEVKAFFGIQSPSKVMRDEVGAMISLGVAEGIEENSEEATKAFQSMLDKLEYQRDFDIINEAQYYAELERLRDEYLTTGTKEWLDYTQKIYEYQTELAQEQEAAIQSTYESLVSSASEAIDEIVSAQQSLASKMKDYGGELYETYSYTFQSERGEQTFEHVRLTDLQGDIDALEQYSASLQAVRQRLKNAGFSDDDTGSFFSVLAGMSVEEGQTFAQALNEATDEEFSGFVSDWLKKQSLSEELSKQIYNDEVAGAVDKLEQELQNAGLEVPEGFFDSGVTAAENFGIGFTEQLQTEMQKISDIVRSFTGSFRVELAAAGTAEGGAYTSSTTTKTYYLQSTNETVHQQLETIRQNDKLEELRNG